MNHIKHSNSKPENEDNSMDWEENKGIERLDERVGENGTSLVDLSENISSECTGQKRKYSFSSPVPAKISRTLWCGEQKEHSSVNETSLCNGREVTSEFSTTQSVSKMIDDSLDNSCQATNGNTSAILANGDTNYSKSDISIDSIPEIHAVSYSNKGINSFLDHDGAEGKMTHPLDTERLLLDSEGSLPDREDPTAKTKGSPPDTEGSSSDTERTSSNTKRTSPDTERTLSDESKITESTLSDVEVSLPDIERISDESRITERTLSDLEVSSSEMEGSSPDTERISDESRISERTLTDVEVSSSEKGGSSPDTERTSDTEDSVSKTKGSSSGTKGSSPDIVGSSPETDREFSDTGRTLSDTERSSPDTEDPTQNGEVISLHEIPPGFSNLRSQSFEILQDHLKSHKKDEYNAIYRYFEFFPPDKELQCKLCGIYASELSPPISP